MIKLKIHSAVDVITNSSSVIYTYTDGCVGPIKELIGELKEVFGFEETVDDMFWIMSTIETDYLADYIYEEYMYDREDEEMPEGFSKQDSWKDQIKATTKFLEKVVKCEIDKPEWLTDLENSDSYGEGYMWPTALYIIPKDEKYKSIADGLLNVVYSTEHVEAYN